MKRLIIKLDMRANFFVIPVKLSTDFILIFNVQYRLLEIVNRSVRPKCGQPNKWSVRKEKRVIWKIKVSAKLSAANIAAELSGTECKRIYQESMGNLLRNAGHHGIINRANHTFRSLVGGKRIQFAKEI